MEENKLVEVNERTNGWTKQTLIQIVLLAFVYIVKNCVCSNYRNGCNKTFFLFLFMLPSFARLTDESTNDFYQDFFFPILNDQNFRSPSILLAIYYISSYSPFK